MGFRDGNGGGGIGKYFGPHYAMERFSILFVLLLLAFVAVIVFCAVYLKVESDVAFRSTAIVETEAVVGTRSGVGMTVEGLATNEDATRAAVMLSFSDMAKMASKAEDYAVHVTAVAPNGAKEELDKAVVGSFYLYGTSGYGAIYMACPEGFDERLLLVTLEDTNPVGISVAEDLSDSDRFAMTLNPGHTDAQVFSDALADGFDYEKFFVEWAISRSEDSQRELLDMDLEVMDESLLALGEYFSRLEDDGVVVTGVMPDAMSGDSIVEDAEGNRALSTRYVFDGGYDFDWRGIHLSEDGSYADKAGVVLTDAMFADGTDSELTSDLSVKEMLHDVTQWGLEDGRNLYEVANGSANAKLAQMLENAQLADSAIQTYLYAKRAYQVDHLRGLFYLEYGANTLSETVSVNENCLEVY